MSLGHKVKERRRALGLRQEELAELAGVSMSFVNFVEHEKPSIQLDKLLQVLKVLGLELDVRVGKQ